MNLLESLLAYCQDNGRVCPVPMHWNELYNLLPDKKRKGLGWEPSLPLILAAWHDTPNIVKMLRLKEHIEWADGHGALEEVDAFLRGLPEEKWHHLGD